MRHALVAGLLALIALPAFAQTGSVTLTCTPPTQYTNGTPIGSAPISYKFYRAASQAGPYTLETKTSSTCGTTYTGLAVGTHWFAATAIVNGVESAVSVAASAAILPVPNPPTGLTVTVNVVVTVGP